MSDEKDKNSKQEGVEEQEEQYQDIAEQEEAVSVTPFVPLPDMPISTGNIPEEKVANVTEPKALKFAKNNVDATIANKSTINYKKRKVRLTDLGEEFLSNYTVACLLRTTPNNMTLPTTFLKLLEGMNYLCKGDIRTPIEGANIIGFATGVEGGHLKSGNSTWFDICRMTADPFPLLISEKDIEKTGKWKNTPLYSVGDGSYAPYRYSRVGLSYLGSIACRHYVGKTPAAIKELKTIVPLALLKKKVQPWTLGHKSINLSFNPGELFALQSKMIDNYEKNRNKEPWLIPDEDVQSIFRGPDLGEGYIGYMTNKALASMFHLGKGSIMIVPTVRVNRNERTIVIEVPPVGRTSAETAEYINFRMIGKDPIKNVPYPLFETFQPKAECLAPNVNIVIRDVIFKGTDEEIINEIQSDKFIKTLTPICNTVLIDKEESINDLNQTLRNLDIQDAELDDFMIDTKPIHELLWQHVVWEYEERLEVYKDRLEKAKEKHEINLFLEKVTRDGVADYIASLYKREYDAARRDMLFEKFCFDSSRDKKLLPEGFKPWEIDEIVRETQTGGRSGVSVPNILFKREKYKDRWVDTQKEIDRLQAMKDNPGKIFAEIKRDLDTWAGLDMFNRKMKNHFIDQIQVSEEEIQYDFKLDQAKWDECYLPCSLYYDRKGYMVKSYGRNINFVPTKEEDLEIQFDYSLNTTNWDNIIVFSKSGQVSYEVNSIPCSPIKLKDFLAVVPFPEESDIMVLVETRRRDVNKKVRRGRSMFFIIPKGGLKEQVQLLHDTSIIGWCYLNKSYVELLGYNRKVGRYTYGRIPTDQIPRDVYQPEFFPEKFDPILDIEATNEDGCLAAIPHAYDYCRLSNPHIISWDEESYLSPLSNLEFHPQFTNHIEMYYNNLFIHSWKKINFVTQEAFNHGKKSVIDELCWCRPDDKVSKKLDALFKAETVDLRSGLHAVFSRDSDSYETYSIAELSDWSVINPRFQLPVVRPDIEEALVCYNEFMDAMFKCKIKDKEFKAFEKRLKAIRTKIIENSDISPYRAKTSNVFIPTGFSDNLLEDDEDNEDIVELDDL